MSKTIRIGFFLLLLQPIPLFYVSILWSADTPPPLSLSLSQVVRAAIQNNVEIQIARENVHLEKSTFFWEKAQFDPSLIFGLRADRTIRSSSSLIETGPSGTSRIIQENQRASAAINQDLRSGGKLDLSFRQFRSKASFQAVNPTFNGDLVLSFTQPLLQGKGREVTEGPIRIASSNIAISETRFQSQVSALILKVSRAYWDLVFQLNHLKIQQQTLHSAKQLLASNQSKVDLGLFPPIEILVAESAVAAREEAVFIAEKGIADTEDQLRLFLNLSGLSNLHPSAIRPTQRPVEKEMTIDFSARIQEAMSFRPELRESRLRIQNQNLTVKLAADKLAPSLDFVSRLGINGLGQDIADEGEQLTSGTFSQWEVGLTLSFPLGNRAAKADLQRERTQSLKIMLDRKKLIQQITLETKEGIRRVQTDYQRIKVTQRAHRLEKEKLSAAHARFNLGLLSSHDLLEFQDDLAGARGKELKAVIDYNKSLVNLDNVTGSLLKRYHIETQTRG